MCDVEVIFVLVFNILTNFSGTISMCCKANLIVVCAWKSKITDIMIK